LSKWHLCRIKSKVHGHPPEFNERALAAQRSAAARLARWCNRHVLMLDGLIELKKLSREL